MIKYDLSSSIYNDHLTRKLLTELIQSLVIFDSMLDINYDDAFNSYTTSFDFSGLKDLNMTNIIKLLDSICEDDSTWLVVRNFLMDIKDGNIPLNPKNIHTKYYFYNTTQIFSKKDDDYGRMNQLVISNIKAEYVPEILSLCKRVLREMNPNLVEMSLKEADESTDDEFDDFGNITIEIFKNWIKELNKDGSITQRIFSDTNLIILILDKLKDAYISSKSNKADQNSWKGTESFVTDKVREGLEGMILEKLISKPNILKKLLTENDMMDSYGFKKIYPTFFKLEKNDTINDVAPSERNLYKLTLEFLVRFYTYSQKKVNLIIEEDDYDSAVNAINKLLSYFNVISKLGLDISDGIGSFNSMINRIINPPKKTESTSNNNSNNTPDLNTGIKLLNTFERILKISNNSEQAPMLNKLIELYLIDENIRDLRFIIDETKTLNNIEIYDKILAGLVTLGNIKYSMLRNISAPDDLQKKFNPYFSNFKKYFDSISIQTSNNKVIDQYDDLVLIDDNSESPGKIPTKKRNEICNKIIDKLVEVIQLIKNGLKNLNIEISNDYIKLKVNNIELEAIQLIDDTESDIIKKNNNKNNEINTNTNTTNTNTTTSDSSPEKLNFTYMNESKSGTFSEIKDFIMKLDTYDEKVKVVIEDGFIFYKSKKFSEYIKDYIISVKSEDNINKLYNLFSSDYNPKMLNNREKISEVIKHINDFNKEIVLSDEIKLFTEFKGYLKEVLQYLGKNNNNSTEIKFNKILESISNIINGVKDGKEILSEKLLNESSSKISNNTTTNNNINNSTATIINTTSNMVRSKSTTNYETLITALKRWLDGAKGVKEIANIKAAIDGIFEIKNIEAAISNIKVIEEKYKEYIESESEKVSISGYSADSIDLIGLVGKKNSDLDNYNDKFKKRYDKTIRVLLDGLILIVTKWIQQNSNVELVPEKQRNGGKLSAESEAIALQIDKIIKENSGSFAIATSSIIEFPTSMKVIYDKITDLNLGNQKSKITEVLNIINILQQIYIVAYSTAKAEYKANNKGSAWIVPVEYFKIVDGISKQIIKYENILNNYNLLEGRPNLNMVVKSLVAIRDYQLDPKRIAKIETTAMRNKPDKGFKITTITPVDSFLQELFMVFRGLTYIGGKKLTTISVPTGASISISTTEFPWDEVRKDIISIVGNFRNYIKIKVEKSKKNTFDEYKRIINNLAPDKITSIELLELEINNTNVKLDDISKYLLKILENNNLKNSKLYDATELLKFIYNQSKNSNQNNDLYAKYNAIIGWSKDEDEAIKSNNKYQYINIIPIFKKVIEKIKQLLGGQNSQTQNSQNSQTQDGQNSQTQNSQNSQTQDGQNSQTQNSQNNQTQNSQNSQTQDGQNSQTQDDKPKDLSNLDPNVVQTHNDALIQSENEEKGSIDNHLNSKKDVTTTIEDEKDTNKNKKVEDSKKSKSTLKKIKEINSNLLEMIVEFNTIRDKINSSDNIFSTQRDNYSLVLLEELANMIIKYTKKIVTGDKKVEQKVEEELAFNISNLLLEEDDKPDEEDIVNDEDEVDDETTEVGDSDVVDNGKEKGKEKPIEVDDEDMMDEPDERVDEKVEQKINDMKILENHQKIMIKILVKTFLDFYNTILVDHRALIKEVYNNNSIIFNLINKISNKLDTNGTNYCLMSNTDSSLLEADSTLTISNYSIEDVSSNIEILKGQQGLTPDSIYNLNPKAIENIKNKNTDDIMELLDNISDLYGDMDIYPSSIVKINKTTDDLLSLKSIISESNMIGDIIKIITGKVNVLDEYTNNTFNLSGNISTELVDELKKLTNISTEYSLQHPPVEKIEQIRFIYKTVLEGDILYPILQSNKNSPLVLLEAKKVSKKYIDEFKKLLDGIKLKFTNEDIFNIIGVATSYITEVQQKIKNLYTPIFNDKSIHVTTYLIRDSEIIQDSKVEKLNKQYSGNVSTSYVRFTISVAKKMIEVLNRDDVKLYPYIDIIFNNYLNKADDIEFYPLLNGTKFALPKTAQSNKILGMGQETYRPKVSYTFQLSEKVGSDMKNAHMILSRELLLSSLKDIIDDKARVLSLSNKSAEDSISKEDDVIIQISGEYAKDTNMFDTAMWHKLKKTNTINIKQVAMGVEVMVQDSDGNKKKKFVTYPKTEVGVNYLLSKNTDKQVDIVENFHYIGCSMFYLALPTYHLSCSLERLSYARGDTLKSEKGRIFLLHGAYYYGEMPNIRTNSGLLDWMSSLTPFGAMGRYKVIEQNSNIKEGEGTRYVILKSESSGTYSGQDQNKSYWRSFHEKIVGGIKNIENFENALLAKFKELKLNVAKTNLQNSEVDKDVLTKKVSFEDQFSLLEPSSKKQIMDRVSNLLQTTIKEITDGVRGLESYDRGQYINIITQDTKVIKRYLRNMTMRYRTIKSSSKSKDASETHTTTPAENVLDNRNDEAYTSYDNYQIVVAMILFQVGLIYEKGDTGRGFTLDAIDIHLDRIEKKCVSIGKLSNRSIDQLTVDSFYTYRVNSEKLINTLTEDGTNLLAYQMHYLKFKSSKNCIILSQTDTDIEKANRRLYIGISYMKGDLRLTHKLIDAIFTGGSHT